MKLNKYIWLAALPMIFTACQDDMLVENSSKQGITTLSATMGNDADSRAQIQLGTYPGTFMWNKGDAFTLFESSSEGEIVDKEFSIDEDYSDENPSIGANFSISEGNPLTAGNSFNAIYPSISNENAGIYRIKDEALGQDYISMTITQPTYNMSTLAGSTEAEKIDNFWKTYFKNSLFMKADGDVTSNTKVNFEHLCGLVRVSYTNNKSQSVTIKKIRLNGDWQKQICLDATTFERMSMQPNLEQLSFSSDGFNLHVNPNETRDFYFLFFPLETSDYEKFDGIFVDYIPDGDANEDVTYRTPSTYRGKRFVAPTFEAGKTYWFKITETGGDEERPYSLAWTAELEGSGNSGNQPGDGELKEDEEGYILVNSETIQQAVIDKESKIRLSGNITLHSPLFITVPTTLDLNKWTLSLAEGIDYSIKELTGADAVLNYSGAGSLYISNGTLSTNTSTTSLHHYYITNTNENGSVELDGVTLETGKAVTNAISAGSSVCALNNSEIVTNGYAVHWECNKSYLSFITYLRDTEITGDIYYGTNKSKSSGKIDKVEIYSCTINGDLVTDFTDTSVTRADVFFKDSYSVTKGRNGDEWTGLSVIHEGEDITGD